jgi:hypothetical protein
MLQNQPTPQPQEQGNPMGNQMQRLMMQLQRDVQMITQAMEMQGIAPDQIQAVIMQAIQGGAQPGMGAEQMQGQEGMGMQGNPGQIQVPPMG